MENNSFRSVYPVIKSSFTLDHESRILSLGSCFSEHIGNRLKLYGFRVVLNPFGILYNPISIASNLQRAMNYRLFDSSDLVHRDSLWHCFDFHGLFSRLDKEQCLEKINDALQTASKAIEKVQVVLLTFGTAWAFRLKKSNQIVANCHKFPHADFERILLNPEEIITCWGKLLEAWLAVNPNIKILISISPVRYLRDGFHGNNLGKASLHLALQELVKQFENIVYFPAYELVTDDLRDYRFYEKDRSHPNTEAVDYVWERFQKVYLSDSAGEIIDKLQQIQDRLNHRPLHESPDQHGGRMQKAKAELADLQKHYPALDLSMLEDIAG